MVPFKSREVRPIRYYVYISDTKLEMLFEQIDQDIRKRVSAEVKVDLKVASLKLSKADDPASTRAAKLRVVERFIDKHHNVGTIMAPGTEYFRGQMDMQWGLVRDPAFEDREVQAVYFKGTASEGRGILLVGSSRHVLGESPAWDWPSMSTYARMMEMLQMIAERSGGQNVGALLDAYPGAEHSIVRAWSVLGEPSYHNELSVPKQRLDFLAIPFAEYTSTVWAHHVVLGTPLYVAMAREPRAGATDARRPRPSLRRGNVARLC